MIFSGADLDWQVACLPKWWRYDFARTTQVKCNMLCMPSVRLHALLLQADYWRQMCGNDNPMVEYGNDVEGTAFCLPDAEDPLGSTGWNLQAS